MMAAVTVVNQTLLRLRLLADDVLGELRWDGSCCNNVRLRLSVKSRF